MAKKRMTDRHVVWLALVGAYQESDSLCDAYSATPDDPVYAAEREKMRAFERVANRYYGRSIIGELNAPFKNARVLTFRELMGFDPMPTPKEND